MRSGLHLVREDGAERSAVSDERDARAAPWSGVPADPLAALCVAAQKGDPQAMQTLLVSVAPAMLRAVRGVLGAHHRDVEDTLQEATHGFVRSLSSFRRECTVLHFACRVAVQTSVVVRRRLRSRGDDRSEPLETPTLVDGDTPAEVLLAARRRAILRELCDSLPTPQCEALILHVVVGYTVEEVADACRAPPETIRSRLRLAKAALRARIVADPVCREALEVEP
jgi:RNA polymerase sigma-70 factor (ECF subfamily)